MQFLSYQKVKELRVPTLFISGKNDNLVPPRMMTELYNRCGSIKQLLQVPGGTHNETWQVHGYYHSLAVFFQNCRLKENRNEFDIKCTSDDNIRNGDNLWNNVQTI